MYPFFICILSFFSGYVNPESSTVSDVDMGLTHHVKTLQKEYAYGDIIKVKARGFFETNGACTIAFGLLKKNTDWDTLADVRNHHTVTLCASSQYYKNETLELISLNSFVSALNFSCPLNTKVLTPGEYRLTFVTAKWRRVVHSNSFTLTDTIQMH